MHLISFRVFASLEKSLCTKNQLTFFICLLFVLRKGSATINLPVSPSPYMYVPSMSSAVCKLPYNRKDWQTFLRVCNSNILLSLYLSCALSLSLSFSVAFSHFLISIPPLRFQTFTFWNSYVLKLLRLEIFTFSDVTFSDVTLSDIHRRCVMLRFVAVPSFLFLVS